jgi:anthranilate synthase component 1
MQPIEPDFEAFQRLAQASPAEGGGTLVPLATRLFSDGLTPVLAYRRLVRPDERMAPSFLLESVVGGDRIGRHSFLGHAPLAEVLAYGHQVTYRHHRDRAWTTTYQSDDPLSEMHKLTGAWQLANGPGLPNDFTGGWVGYAGYDTVRYLEGEKLTTPPPDDRHLPDLHMQLYTDVVVFDHVKKLVWVITHVRTDQYDTLEAAYDAGQQRLDATARAITTPAPRNDQNDAELAPGRVELDTAAPKLPTSTMGEGGYQNAVERIKKYIEAGDAFQVVPSQRFDLQTTTDPFDIYRTLRVVNPSPYMFYLQIEGGMLVGSSPEILCHVQDGTITNRPLAGTRKRGGNAGEDAALEQALVSDPKDRAEHIMLVDLGRNDVGRIAEPGTIELPEVLAVERYSHVMHLSSTVKGKLRDGATCWDALRYTLPVGTVSGAPKVRAMQIIDEVEPTRRGPYGGAVGYADFAGNMDMAIALRTMVIMPAEESEQPTEGPKDQGDGGSAFNDRGAKGSKPGASTYATSAKPGASTYATSSKPGASTPRGRPSRWQVYLQAGGGIVADSDPDAEHQETVNKAAALGKAVELAERAFAASPTENAELAE